MVELGILFVVFSLLTALMCTIQDLESGDITIDSFCFILFISFMPIVNLLVFIDCLDYLTQKVSRKTGIGIPRITLFKSRKK